MNCNGRIPKGMTHSDDSDIDLGSLKQGIGSCCRGRCGGRCGCNCAGCLSRMNAVIGDQNTSSWPMQGGHDQRLESAHATCITPTMNSLTTRQSFQDDVAAHSNSYEAHVPTAGPLTCNNVEQLNEQSGGLRSHETWLQQHYEDVDQNPADWFKSPIEAEGFDAAGAIEGGGLEESFRSLQVAHDPLSESLSMLSQYTSSFSRSSVSASTILPDMRHNLVYRPLSLVPECHHVPISHRHPAPATNRHHTYGSG